MGGCHVFKVSVATGVVVVVAFESAVVVAAGSVILGFDLGCDFGDREG